MNQNIHVYEEWPSVNSSARLPRVIIKYFPSQACSQFSCLSYSFWTSTNQPNRNTTLIVIQWIIPVYVVCPISPQVTNYSHILNSETRSIVITFQGLRRRHYEYKILFTYKAHLEGFINIDWNISRCPRKLQFSWFEHIILFCNNVDSFHQM